MACVVPHTRPPRLASESLFLGSDLLTLTFCASQSEKGPVASACKMIHQCDLKALTLGALYLAPKRFFCPATEAGHVAAEGEGRQAEGLYSFVFLGWMRPGVCGALPFGSVLKQLEWGRFMCCCHRAWPEGKLSILVFSQEFVESCLGVDGMDATSYTAISVCLVSVTSCETSSKCPTLPGFNRENNHNADLLCCYQD